MFGNRKQPPRPPQEYEGEPEFIGLTVTRGELEDMDAALAHVTEAAGEVGALGMLLFMPDETSSTGFNACLIGTPALDPKAVAFALRTMVDQFDEWQTEMGGDATLDEFMGHVQRSQSH